MDEPGNADLAAKITALTSELKKTKAIVKSKDLEICHLESNVVSLQAKLREKDRVIGEKETRLEGMVKTLRAQTSSGATSKVLTIEASCSHILNLPLPLLANIFTEFLALGDVARFDLAATNHEGRLRSVYLTMISDPLLVFKQSHIACKPYSHLKARAIDWLWIRKMHMSVLNMTYITKLSKHESFPLGLTEVYLEKPTQAVTRQIIDKFPLTLRKFSVKNAAIKLDDLKRLLINCKSLTDLSIDLYSRRKTPDFESPLQLTNALARSQSLKSLSIEGFQLKTIRQFKSAWSISYLNHTTTFSGEKKPGALLRSCLVEHLTLSVINGFDSDLESLIEEVFPRLKTLSLKGYSGGYSHCSARLSERGIQRIQSKGIDVTNEIPLVPANEYTDAHDDDMDHPQIIMPNILYDDDDLEGGDY